MRLSIPLRQTKKLDLEDLLNEALLSFRQAESLVLEHADPRSIAVNNDITVLAQLRSELENHQDQLSEDKLEIYMRYLGGLIELAKRTDLQNVGFSWVNGLCHSKAVIRGMGIWFEITNVLYNIAALQTHRASQCSMTKDSSRYLRCAAGTFKYLSQVIVPKLKDPPPPELSTENLQLLESLCITLSLEPIPDSWALSLHYRRIAKELSQALFTNHDWQKYFEKQADSIARAACLELAKSLHRSRKTSDHVLAKAALTKCLSLSAEDGDGPINSEAQKLLETPFNRRSKKCLADLEDIEFNPASYFGEEPHFAIPESEVFAVPYSGLFSSLLPERLYYTAFIARELIAKQVDLSICEKLYAMNQRLRSSLVTCALPAGIEISMRPGSVPSSLVRLVKDLRTRLALANEESPLHCLFPVCEKQIDDLHTIINKSQDENNLGPVRSQLAHLAESFDGIKKFVSSHHSLLQLFKNMSTSAEDENIELQLRDYLDIPAPRNSNHKQRSNPAFLERVFELEKTVSAKLDEYEAQCARVQAQVKSLDIFETIKPYLDTILLSPKDEGVYNAVLKSAVETELSHFTEEMIFISHNEKVVESLDRMIKESWARFQKFNTRPMLTGECDKVKAVQIAMTMIYRWYDIDRDLSNLRISLEKLLKLARLAGDKSVEVPSASTKVKEPTLIKSFSQTQTDPATALSSTFAWRPGTNVEICIK